MDFDWTDFGDDKRIATFGKVVVVTNSDLNLVPPLFCGCCLFPMKTVGDSSAFRRHGVCYPCEERWACVEGVTLPKGPPKDTTFWGEYMEGRFLVWRSVLTLK